MGLVSRIAFREVSNMLNSSVHGNDRVLGLAPQGAWHLLGHVWSQAHRGSSVNTC